jgi:hypothetical protein
VSVAGIMPVTDGSSGKFFKNDFKFIRTGQLVRVVAVFKTQDDVEIDSILIKYRYLPILLQVEIV